MVDLMPQFLTNAWEWSLAVFYSLPPLVQYLTIVTWKILFVTIGVILIVAFSTYFERKVIGSMQGRIGPNRVGPLGLGQPFADVIKLLIKEVVVPSQSNKFLFVIAPLLTLIPALATWAVIPLNDWYVIADIDAGLLYVLALTSVGVYALGSADSGVRNRDGIRARRHIDGGGQPQHRRHRQSSVGRIQ